MTDNLHRCQIITLDGITDDLANTEIVVQFPKEAYADGLIYDVDTATVAIVFKTGHVGVFVSSSHLKTGRPS